MGFLLVLASLCWAGPVKTAAPVQLRLELAPEAASPRSLRMPVPAAVASAIKAGDPHAFYAAAIAHEYAPPHGDEVQERLAREGAERKAADRAYFQRQREAEFIRAGSRLSTSAFGDTAEKRRLMTEVLGYADLKGSAKTEYPQAQIGKAFANTLKSLRRKHAR